MIRPLRLAVVLTLAGMLLSGSGCKREEEPKLEPKIAPPAIAQAGVLRAGVDLSVPPFGGEDAGMKAGLDVDVAAALAEKLGLTVEYVDIKPSEAASALADGGVDVVFSVKMGEADLSNATVAGTYVVDAPALFVATDSTASVEPSLTLATMPVAPVAVQNAAEAYWLLESEFGTATIQTHDSLRAAFDALDRGDVTLAAGDAIVGAYIGRDFPRIHYAGTLADPYPLGVAVAAENSALSDSVRAALDALAADGVLDNVRGKWVGGLPALEVPGAERSEEATS